MRGWSRHLARPTRANYFIMPVTPALTNNEISLSGLPFIAPILKAVHEPAGQFLYGELFPNSPRGKPLPPELFQQLAAKNLVLYHWEITSERMTQLLQLSQIGLMITQHKQLDSGSAAFKWLQKIGPALGNTSTEITQTGPAELTFARKAPGVFTALELYALANWLEADNFPGCNLKMHAAFPENATPAPAAIAHQHAGSHARPLIQFHAQARRQH